MTMLDCFKCPICLDYASDAVMTICCEQIHCENCVQPLLNKECSNCREPKLETAVSKFARRVIGDLPAVCPYKCDEKITRASLSTHKEICSLRSYECPITTCKYAGLKAGLLSHAVQKHDEKMFQALRTLPSITCGRVDVALQTDKEPIKTEKEPRKYYCPFQWCSWRFFYDPGVTAICLEEHLIKQHKMLESDWFRDIFHSGKGPIEIRNSQNRFAEMATNGKFYCGHEEGSYKKPPREEGKDVNKEEKKVTREEGKDVNKEEKKVTREEGKNVNKEEHKVEKKVTRMACTSENRLNCWSCMKLDVTMRNLPYGSLLNGVGQIAVPNFCTHKVKGSAYFANNGRSVLCRGDQCGNTPQFCCPVYSPESGTKGKQQGTGSTKCTRDRPCPDCEHLNYVYTLVKANDTSADFNYYGPVWEK